MKTHTKINRPYIILMIATLSGFAAAQSAISPPPNQLGPVYDYENDSILNSNDPNLVIEVDNIFQQFSALIAPPKPVIAKYWQRRYHRQVNDQVFQVLHYPFYATGQLYAQTPSETDPDTSQTVKSQHQIEKLFDQIHIWRNINESEAATLEVRHAIELTKTSTSIYQINPDLAVQVKRTLGKIGRTNVRFEQISRRALQQILQNDPDPIFCSRLEKRLADLQSLFDRLAQHNDAISQALGIGTIKRTAAIPAYLDTIDYSAKRLPEPATAINQ